MYRSKEKKEIEMSKLEVSYGNSKLKGPVMIYNMGPSLLCPTDALAMCPYGPKHGDNSCYAARPERMYKQVLPYRMRQMDWWKNHFDPFSFVYALRKKTKYFRFSEAGDFEGQKDVEKMTLVCDALRSNDITCYGYSGRYDLDFTTLNEVANVAISGKKLKGCSVTGVLEKGDEMPTKGKWHVCPGKNCLVECFACTKKNTNILFHKH